MDKIISLILRFFSIIFPFVTIGEAHSFIAAILLVVSNAIPVFGVAFLGWEPVFILVLYWVESVVIGIFNVIMMFISGLFSADGTFDPSRFVMAVFLTVFFTFHYGFFMAIHGVFVFVLFLRGNTEGFGMGDVSALYAPDKYLPAVCVIFISQIFTFFAFFIKNKWYCNNSPENFMIRPYPRVFIMQVTIIFGAVVMTFSGWNMGPIIIWVSAKTIVDLITFGWSLKSMKNQKARMGNSQ